MIWWSDRTEVTDSDPTNTLRFVRLRMHTPEIYSEECFFLWIVHFDYLDRIFRENFLFWIFLWKAIDGFFFYLAQAAFWLFDEMTFSSVFELFTAGFRPLAFRGQND